MKRKFIVPIALMSSLTFSTFINSPTLLLSNGLTHVEAATTLSPILITELLPNSSNVVVRQRMLLSLSNCITIALNRLI